MAGKKGRKRGPSRYVKFAAKALNETLNAQVNDMLAVVMTAAAEKKSREEIAQLLRDKFLSSIQTWVDEGLFDLQVVKLVGISVTVDTEADDDEEEDDGDENGD